MAKLAKSQKLELRVSEMLYRWVDSEAKRQGFRSKASYLRYVLETLRLEQRQRIDKGV